MENKEFQWLSHLENSIPESAKGYSMSFYAIALEGWRRGLTLKFINENRRRSELLFELASDKKSYKFVVSRGELITSKAMQICRNKIDTKEYLQKSDVKTPKGKLFEADTKKEDIVAFAEMTGYPLVIKPSDGTGGKGVIAGINDKNEFAEALNYIREKLGYKEVIVEDFFEGEDYRVYVIDNEVVGIIKRIPANVVGDGKSSVQNLIIEKNKLRKQSPILGASLIKVDLELRNMLKDKGYTLSSVPLQGERVYLKSKNNISAGGDPVDITDEVSDEIKQVAIDGINAIPGLPHGGVDLMVDAKNNKATVIEINTQANIRTHLFPMIGKARDVPSKLIDYYFPETKQVIRAELLYFDIEEVKKTFTNRTIKEYLYPNVPKGKINATRFLINGDIQGVNYGTWIRRQANELSLNGYIKFLENNQASIIIAGEELKIEEFRKIIKTNSLKGAKVFEIEEKNRNTPVQLGFQIKNAHIDRKIEDGYFPIRLEGISKLGQKKPKTKMKPKKQTGKSQNQNFEKKYNQIIRSKSWRLTKPIRVIGRLIKGRSNTR